MIQNNIADMLRSAVKLARPRTWAFIILAYLIGWSLSAANFSLQYAIGLFSYILLVADVNIINAYTDIEEDKINLPQRVKVVEKLGNKRLPYMAAVISAVSLALSLTVNFVFALVFIIALLNAIFYSLKPIRFKSRPAASLISFSGAVVFPLVGAWVVTESFFSIPALFFLLGYSFLAYGTVKNLPDYYGDKAVGLKTTATIFTTRKKAIVAATILLLSPYVLLLAFAAAQIIEYKFLWLLTLLPLIVLICYRALTKSELDSLEKLHTYGFFYQALVLAETVFLVANLLNAVIIVGITLLVTFLIQRTGVDSR